jgi:membrane-associated phospholipid phosphatase
MVSDVRQSARDAIVVAMTAAAREFSARSDIPLWLVVAPVVLLVAGLVAVRFDVPAVRWLDGGHLPGSLGKAISISEAFTHGIGVAVIVALVWLLDRFHRAGVVRIALGTIAAGTLADLGKLLVGRTRPRYLPDAATSLDTFTGWIPDGMYAAHQSFPSGHAAIGFALAVLLSWHYPAGRPVFIGLAILGALQRIVSGLHYPSDVLVGAAVGCACALAFLPGGVIGRRLSPLDARLAPRLQQ